MSIEFVGFPKMARLSREIIITEKIDGTNAAVDFFLAKGPTAALTGSGSVFKATPGYEYLVWYETAGGVRKTLVYGTGNAADGGPA